MEKKDKIQLLNQLALVIGGISFFIAVLLLLNYWNIQKTDPIESKALAALVERLRDEPNNDVLKLEIRNLDLLARKAYFTSHWQVRAGGFLLLFSSVFLILILKILSDMKKKIELPEEVTEKGMMDRVLSQRWIGVIGILVVTGALLASFTSKDYLERYEPGEAETFVEVETDPGIEVIEVASEESGDTDLANIEDDDNTSQELVDNKEVDSDPPTIGKGEEPEPVEDIKEAVVTETSSSYPDLNEIKKHHNNFRGPLGQGISHHKGIPVSWDVAAGTNILWKVEVPTQGNNSPIIWGDKLFIAGADAASRWIYCHDRNTGKLLWEHEAKDIEGSPVKAPRTTPDTGLAAPTLSTDGQRVYAIFGTGDVLALDLNGKRLWARNLGVPDNHYGHSSSLICWEEKLVVQYDTNKSGRLLAINVLSGETIWEVSRNIQISWASPVLAEIEGKYQVLTTSAPLVIGHDLETGKELWNVECMMGEVGPSVGFADGIVFASNEYARMVAIKPGQSAAEVVWEQDEYLPEASSPVVADGLVFLGTSYGVFACFDAKTGDMVWEFEGNSGFYGSPMAVDGKIYVMDMSGICYIFEISKELKLIGEPSLGEKSIVTPAFAEGRIYLRGSKFLYCIGD